MPRSRSVRQNALPADSPSSHADLLNAARRQIILDAAQRVFERLGLRNTTLRAIAREAGCTTGAIYPWFEGKEALYGALLETSLRRLQSHLSAHLEHEAGLDTGLDALPASRAGAAERPNNPARRVVQAFFDYYAQRPAEFSLGLYLFQGVAPQGLGRELDQRLNACLAECVDLLGVGLRRTDMIAPARIATMQMNVFTYLMGLLLLQHTGRLKSLDQRAQTLLDAYCATLETLP